MVKWKETLRRLILKDYIDPLIDSLIRPPRQIFRGPKIKLIGLERVELDIQASNGDHARHRLLAEQLQPATELREAR